MFRRRDVRHDCPTDEASVDLPTIALSATFPWRCPECGQRWWCVMRRHGSFNFERIGRASRRWRRANRPVVRLVPSLRVKKDA